MPKAFTDGTFSVIAVTTPTALAAASNPIPEIGEGNRFATCYLLRRRVESASHDLIWLAHDEVLEKDVSLHFLPAAVRMDSRVMDALRAEVKRARQFIHPHILRVYDLIEDTRSAAIAMDGFAAESLAVILQRKQRGFFEPEQIQPWLYSLCQTLEDAHRIQLLHRDISPPNILLDKSGNVIVTKFGISRLVRDAMSRVRAAGEPEPGLAYMSPQQVDGDPSSIADDIYAFGVLLHELLTGEAPFIGTDIVSEIRHKPAPSIADHRAELRKTGAAIPSSWEKVVATCLAKNPEQRPKSMAEVASQLALQTTEVTSPAAPQITGGTSTIGAAPSAEMAGTPRVPSPLDPRAGPDALTTAATPPAKLEPANSGSLGKIRQFERAQAIQKTKSIPKREPATELGKMEAFVKPVPSKSEPIRKTELREKTAPKPSPEVKPEFDPGSSEIPVSDQYSSFDLGRSSFPLTGLAAAAILIMIGVYGLFFYAPGRAAHGGIDATNTGTLQDSELTAVTNPNDRRDLAGEESGVVSPLASSTGAAAARGQGTAISAPTRPDPNVEAKTAALEKAQQALEAAEKAHAEVIKQKEEVEAAVAQAQKVLDDKGNQAAPTLKAAEDVVVQRKAREEELRQAETAEQQAQEAALEKGRMADEAKKALANVEKEEKDKALAKEKAQSELKELQAVVDEKRQRSADMAKTLTGAATQREERAASVKRSEQELAEARKVAEEAARQLAEKRRKIEADIAEARAAFEKKMAELEGALKNVEGAPTAPASTKAEGSAPVQGGAVSGDATSEAKSPAAKSASVETLLAMKTPAKPSNTATPEQKKGTGAHPGFENSLGMKFAPVGDVLFCIWQTRVKDFESFARATGLKSTVWRDPGFRQGPDHPVVNVTWREAMAFCKWLTAKEQKEGLLAPNQEYRLPYDLEWSKAVDLPEETGKTPEARDMGVPDMYPWGNSWPPPKGAGNYTGEETGSDVAIKGYDDGFAWTSPVGSFAPNKYGLYDMGGNVWQWCIDSWNAEQKGKVLRGASWYNGALPLSLLSSCRVNSPPDSSTDNYGFRCVVAEADSGQSAKR